MTKAAKEVAYFLNNRPLCFLSTVFSFRDALLGFGLLFGRPDFTRTLLHHNLDQLGGAWIYGLLIMIIAIFTGFTAVRDYTKLTQLGLRVQSWFWLFACVSYLINGNYLLASVWFFMASLPSGYIAFYYKYTPIWESPKREWRARYGLEEIR
jgi:hypothetical protein